MEADRPLIKHYRANTLPNRKQKLKSELVYLKYQNALIETKRHFHITVWLQLALFISAVVVSIEYFRILGISSSALGILLSVLGIVLVHLKGSQRFCHVQILKAFVALEIAGALLSAVAAIFNFQALARYQSVCDPNNSSITSLNCPPEFVLAIASAVMPVLLTAFLFGAIYSRRFYNLTGLINAMDTKKDLEKNTIAEEDDEEEEKFGVNTI
jgi:hypothetical protein